MPSSFCFGLGGKKSVILLGVTSAILVTLPERNKESDSIDTLVFSIEFLTIFSRHCNTFHYTGELFGYNLHFDLIRTMLIEKCKL